MQYWTTGSGSSSYFDDFVILKRLFFFSLGCFLVKIYDFMVNSMRLMDLSNSDCEKLV